MASSESGEEGVGVDRRAPASSPDLGCDAPGSAWSFAWPRLLFSLNSPLGSFARSVLSESLPGVASPAAGPWPCPPPYGWGQGVTPSDPRRRRAHRRRLELRLLVNVVVVCLSHLALRGSRCCPSWARSGRELSKLQWSVVARLKFQVRSMLDPGVSGPGRSHRVALIGTSAVSVATASIGEVLEPRTSLNLDKIVNSRSPFMKSDSNFNPLEFLSVFHAAAYVEPALLDRSRLPGGSPGPGPPVPPQRGCTRELIDYLRRWDSAGRLLLVEPGGVPKSQCGGLFPVAKDEATDRIVFNRIPRNAHEVHLTGYAKYTVSGHDLIDLEVPPNCEPRIWSQDISDYFPAFAASPARGRSNALSSTAPLAAFEGTRAHANLLRACRRSGRAVPTRVRPCNQGLVMGDLNAADFAAEAHTKLLRQAGSLDPAHTVQNGKVFPRGPHVELLVIDDHVGIAVEPPGQSVVASRVSSSFAAGASAYARNGLITSDKKRRAGVSAGVVLGAEFVHGSPWLGAERSRRLGLASASLRLARARRCTSGLGAQLVGSWVHCLLYRRPLMSLMSRVCSWFATSKTAPREEVRPLSGGEANELALLAFLSPLMSTNLKAGWHPRLVSTDASPFGAGSVTTPVPEPILREFWRHREKRGTCTRVFGEWSTRLRLSGLPESADELAGDCFGTSPSPERILIETFDFLEIACGLKAPLTSALARENLRVGPRIDLLQSGLWDLGRSRVVEWILFLIVRRRVFVVHSGAPCTDHSIAKHPKVRSADHPWGFAPKEEDRVLPNFLLGVALACLLAASRVGVAMTHEHPASAFSWKIPFWRWFVSRPGSEIARFAACSFGAPYMKDSRLARCHAPWLSVLDCPCVCSQPHDVQLHGSLTRSASEYLPGFCSAYARAVKAAHDANPPQLGVAEAESFSCQRSGIFELTWLNDFIRGAPWTVRTSRREPDPAHINVKELRTLLCETCEAGAETPSSRVLSCSDSRVSIGALGKGRSASRILNSEIQVRVPDIVGFDIYPGGLFNPTRLTPADDPSRLRPSPPAGPVVRPSWWNPLLEGRFDEFDYWAALPKQSYRTSEWARIVTKLLWARNLKLSPKDDGWDPTLGYPGEGPARAKPPPEAAFVDLRTYRNLTPAVALRRARLRLEFALFVRVRLAVPLLGFLQSPAPHVDAVLSDFGQFLFRSGRSRLDYSETINAIVDECRGLKGSLPRSWDVAWVWRSLLPAGNRTAMPEKVFLALLSLALLWGWHDMAVLLGTGFLGMLRPHELRGLRARDFLTPRRLLSDFPAMYVVISAPKMRKLTARRAYTRIDELGFVEYIDALLGLFPEDCVIYPGTYAQLRHCFNLMCSALDLPIGAPTGLTLGSLRPGGATWLFRLTDDSEKVRFRGRWTSHRMLEIYIQEIGASALVPSLPAPTRERVAALAKAAPGLLAAAAAALADTAAHPAASRSRG